MTQNIGTHVSQVPQRVWVDANGVFKIPEKVIESPNVANQIYQGLKTDHIKRKYMYALVNGLIAGNPPYDADEQEAAGLGSASNFNTLEARSLYKRAGLAYWNLLFTSSSVIDIILNYDDPQAPETANILSEKWNKIVRREWKGFDVNVAVFTGQLVKLGIAPIMWSDERDFRWKSVNLARFYIPNQTVADLDQLATVCIESEFSLLYLIQAYNSLKDEENSEWNREVLKEYISEKANNVANKNTTQLDPVKVQQYKEAGNVGLGELYNENVTLVSLFYRENDGAISHYMWDPNWNVESKGFLYESPKQYTKLEEAMLIFTQTPGEEYVHANKGTGHEIFSLGQAKLMLDNNTMDMTMFAGTPIIKGSNNPMHSTDSLRLVPGMPTDIGGSEFVENTTGANLQSVIQTGQYFSSLIEKNIELSGGNPANPDSSSGSLAPSEARIKAFKEFGVLKNQTNHFYTTFDVLLEQMVIKMLNCKATDPSYEIVKMWKDECLEAGVPEELFKIKDDGKLPPKWEVKATRSAGSGSQVADIIGLQEMGPIVGSLDARGQVNYTKDFVRAVRGSEFVNHYTAGLDNPDKVSGGAALAAVENFMMKSGEHPLFSIDLDHRAHITTHMALGQEIVQQQNQQQIDVVQADRVLSTLVPHIEEHLQALQGSIFAKEFLGTVIPSFHQLQQFAQLTRRNAQRALQAQQKKQQEDQAATETVMSDAQRKDFVAQKDAARADEKVTNQVDRAAKADERRGQALEKTTDSKVEATRRKTDAEVAAKAAKGGPSNPPLEQSNPSQELNRIAGNTLSPSDIEYNR